MRCDASCVYEWKRPWRNTVYQRRRDKVAGVRLERTCIGWLAWRNNRLVRFGGLAHQFLQTLFQTGLPGVRRRQHLPWLVIRLHCVSRKELQHWRRNSWKRPAYMPSCHAELPCLGRGTRNRQHACPPLFRPTYTNREPVFWTTRRINDKHFARATSHEPRVLWRAPFDTGVCALKNSLSKANCMASWNPAMSYAFCTSTA